MTISITEVIDSPPDLDVVTGVETHADTHHVAVLSATGARLGDLQVPATPAGYDQLLIFDRSPPETICHLFAQQTRST